MAVSFTKDRNKILLLALICLFGALFFQEGEAAPLSTIRFLGLLVGLTAAVALCLGLCRERAVRRRVLAVGVFVAAWALFVWVLGKCRVLGVQDNAHCTMLFLPTGLAAALFLIAQFYRAQKGCISWDRAVFHVMLLGFAIQLTYVLFTSVYIRQNDVYPLSYERGHLYYVARILEERGIPAGDPRAIWQFYHPPLHHAIAAVWLKLNLLMGRPMEVALQYQQFLSLFYVGATMVCFDRLARRIGAPGRGRLVSMGVLILAPTVLILSGSVNNDALVLLLMVLCLDAFVQWYRSPQMKNILRVGLWIGLAMMTKTNAVLLAPPMALLFLVVWVRQKGQFWKMAGQYAAFGGVSLPLGLWWPVRNFARYGMPLMYVAKVGEGNKMNVSRWPVLRRIFDISPALLERLCICWENTDPRCDYNIPVAAFKMLVLGERATYLTNTLSRVFGTLLFWTILLALIWVLALAARAAFARKYDGGLRLFFGACVASMSAMYIGFCLKFYHICSVNPRYILPGILLTLIFAGMGVGEYGNPLRRGRGEAVVDGVIALALGLVCACLCVTYGVYLLVL